MFTLLLMPGLIFSLMIYSWCNASFSYAQTEYTSSGLRDPFENWLPRPEPLPLAPEEPSAAPVAAVEAPKAQVAPPEIALEGIVAGGPRPQAVIQGKIVRVGDTISGARIAKITKEGIEVMFEGETFMIPAPSRAVKTTQGGKNVPQ